MESGWSGQSTVIALRAAVGEERSQGAGREQETVCLPNVVEGAVRRLRDPVEKASKTAKSATISKQHPALFRGTGVSGASGVIVFRLKTHAMERI